MLMSQINIFNILIALFYRCLIPDLSPKNRNRTETRDVHTHRSKGTKHIVLCMHLPFSATYFWFWSCLQIWYPLLWSPWKMIGTPSRAETRDNFPTRKYVYGHKSLFTKKRFHNNCSLGHIEHIKSLKHVHYTERTVCLFLTGGIVES